jgi:hypothetical protein
VGTSGRVEKSRFASGPGWLTSMCFVLLWSWLLGLLLVHVYPVLISPGDLSCANVIPTIGV